MENALPSNGFKSFTDFGLGIPLFIIMLLAMMILPLPPFLLDILFTFNITLSLVVLLAGTYSSRPLDFSVFPTILLVTTLMRLALNIASTRIVLLEGHTGTDAVGQVIKSFGEVVIGGNYAVGMVVFLIVVIINFVVVTKGGGRISEVSARFTLDSMPGKQMAIDADLNAGIINQDEAKERREEVAQEADFYGSMDGASKFVRGDAIAGILILLINVIGGFAIGIFQHDLSAGEAARVYMLLSIGDGLVAQIPSILLSTAAAIMVTRVSSSHDVGLLVKQQLFKQNKVLIIAGAVLFILGVIPGMPHFIFLSIGSILCGAAYYLHQRDNLAVDDNPQVTKKEDEPGTDVIDEKEVSWDDVSNEDPISLEVGYKIIPLVEESTGAELMGRIKGVRRKLSQELGFLVPSVHIRDDLNLQPSQYRISMMGVVMGEFHVHLDKELAISSGKIFSKIEGIETKDPAFGLDAIWIDASEKEQAQTKGYTVVDPSTVIATHLSQIIQDHAHEILGYDEAQKILERLGQAYPKLIEDLIPDKLQLSILVKVFQNLLKEHIPLRDARSIVETLSSQSNLSQDPAVLTEAVRTQLGRLIVQQLVGSSNELPVITLDPNLEQILQKGLQTGTDSQVVEPMLLKQIQTSIVNYAQDQVAMGNPVILLVNNNIRPFLSRLLRPSVQELSVLAFNEIPDDKQITVVSTLGNSA
tara:strand:+ start:105052 stop:107148 length:2097 start_codon:yes stop_codon:yes gene_type:complete